eukprot:CAMPEP_0174275202 /NCGR_PEP_ID=MMETSP0439-20130205/59698_1 /TAXON_ID=0 /ORGANISM="Stereomyxa ramosa, Strain Chinc5" /LENGTH=1210 /DNA_ID=CAMNT_0015367285 /DNA_START=30 /DNA_END=3662 /DNA_ORIENTATION=+
MDEGTAAIKIQSVWRGRKQRKQFNELMKLSAYRKQIANEILDTEVQYVSDLRLVVDEFLKPLRKAVADGSPILSEPEIRTIFSTIEIIVTINGEFLEGLKERMENWHPNLILGDKFEYMAGVLKIYTDYVQHFDEALLQLQESRKQKKFKKFCTKTFLDIGKPLGQLTAYLITPVQRVPRYQLLLKDLLRHTWKTHPDYENINEALKKTANTAAYLNEKQNEVANIQKMVEIQSLLYGKKIERLIDPHRRFIKEGGLDEINEKGKMKSRWFFLFTDIMVRCQSSKRSLNKKSSLKNDGTMGGLNRKCFEYLGKLPLHSAELINHGDDGSKKHSFEVLGSRDSIWVCATSLEEKRDWMAKISDCISKCKAANEQYNIRVKQIAERKSLQAKMVIEEGYNSDDKTAMTRRLISGFENELNNSRDRRSSGSIDRGRSFSLSYDSYSEEWSSDDDTSGGSEISSARGTPRKFVSLKKDFSYNSPDSKPRRYSVDQGTPKLRKFARKKSLKQHRSLTLEETEIIDQQSKDDFFESVSDRDSKKARRKKFSSLNLSKGLRYSDSSEIESDTARRRKFAQMNRDRYHSLQRVNSTGEVFEMEEESPRTRKFASMKRGSYKDLSLDTSSEVDVYESQSEGDTTPRRRRFASMKRESYKEGYEGEESGSSGDVTPRQRNFAKIKRHSYKSNRSSSDPEGMTPEEETPRRRQFSSMKREDYRSSKSDSASFTVSENEDDPSTPNTRKFSSMQRQDFRRAKEERSREAASEDDGSVTPRRRKFSSMQREDFRHAKQEHSSHSTSEDDPSTPRRRKFSSMQREDFRKAKEERSRETASEASEDDGSTPRRRKFSSMQREDYRKAKDGRRDSVSEDDGSTPRRRKFSSMQREDFRKAKEERLSQELSSNEAPSEDDPLTPRSRKFSSMQREDYRKAKKERERSGSSDETGTPRRRKFSSMQREDYRNAKQNSSDDFDLSSSSSSNSSVDLSTKQKRGSTEKTKGGGRRRFSSMERRDYRNKTPSSSQDLISDAKEGRRKFTSMKRENFRDSLKTTPHSQHSNRSSGEEVRGHRAESNPTPSSYSNSKRRFSNMKRENFRDRVSGSKEQTTNPSTKTRKFAQLKRDSYTPSLASGGKNSKESKGSGIETGGESGGGSGKRRFANMKRENFRDSLNSSLNSPSDPRKRNSSDPSRSSGEVSSSDVPPSPKSSFALLAEKRYAQET